MNTSAIEKVTASGGEYVIQKRLGKEDSDEGNVYKAVYRDAIICAFKEIKADVGKKEQKIGLIGSIINEVKLLSLLKHPNLVRIIDYGNGKPQRKKDNSHEASADEPISQQIFAESIPYITMDFIEGSTLDEELCHPGNLESTDFLQKLLKWLTQIANVITYLHRRGILHMDIKPKNILIENGTDNVVLIDLGDAVIADINRFEQYFKTESVKLSLNDKIRVFFDPNYAWSEIQHMKGGLISRDEIRKILFPRKDLQAFGKIINEIVSTISSKCVENPDVKNSEIVIGLKEIANRLEKGYYKDDTQSEERIAAYFACKDVGQCNPRSMYSFDVPELSNYGEGKVIQLSEEDSVWVSKRSSKIIDHPFFQRLRNIAQLDYVSLIYPDARHSRFSHSLHTYSLAKRAVLSLLSDVNFRISGVDVYDIQGFLLFALLHDIGHYPLSHMFEDVLEGKSPLDDPIIDDEKLFRPMIEGGDDSSVGKVIREKLGEHKGIKSISELIIEQYEEPTLKAMYSIWDCTMEKAAKEAKKPVHWVLAGLISSAIDVDKIAYLKEDSDMSGVNYGKGIDIQGYISNLKMPLAKSMADKCNRPIIALNDKGFAAAESIILARYWMLSKVYWHHTNRMYMSGFKFLLNSLLFDQGQLKFSEYFKNVFWASEKDAATYIISLYSKLSNVNPLDQITEGKRPTIKRFLVVGSTYDTETFNYLLRRADESTLLERIRVDASNFLNDKKEMLTGIEKISTLLEVKEGNLSLKKGSFTIDIPRKERDRLHLKNIFVIFNDGYGKTESLSGCSKLLCKLGDEALIRIKKCRIFIHPSLLEFLKENFLCEDMRNVIKSQLQTSSRP